MAPKKASNKASSKAGNTKDTKATKQAQSEKQAAEGDVKPTTEITADDSKDSTIESKSNATQEAETKSKKRKSPASGQTKSEKAEEPEQKAPRRSTRSASAAQNRNGDGQSKNKSTSSPSQLQVISYLLSPPALDLLRTDDEKKALNEDGEDGKSKPTERTYSATSLSPFAELMSAVVLSRPISHTLGHRSIRTLLNEPYSFLTAKAVREAGEEKCVQSMWDAHTQHKEKTAHEIFGLATTVLEDFGGEGDDKEGESLEGVRKAANKDVSKERSLLKEKVKGIGPTGLDIFFRRVQWRWLEAYPFIDDRTKKATTALGLPSNADELVDFIEQNWSELSKMELEGADDEEKKRRAFCVVLERAIEAGLEKKESAVKEAASQT